MRIFSDLYFPAFCPDSFKQTACKYFMLPVKQLFCDLQFDKIKDQTLISPKRMMDSPFLSFGRIRHCKTKFGFGEKDQKG